MLRSNAKVEKSASKPVAGVWEYVNRFPPEVRRAIEGLSNDVRQAIVMVLSEEERLRFSALHSILRVSKSDLAFHLNRLVQAGLVSHVYEEFPSDEGRAYYRLSEVGENLIRGIEYAFIPPASPSESIQPLRKFLFLRGPSIEKMDRLRPESVINYFLQSSKPFQFPAERERLSKEIKIENFAVKTL